MQIKLSNRETSTIGACAHCSAPYMASNTITVRFATGSLMWESGEVVDVRLSAWTVAWGVKDSRGRPHKAPVWNHSIILFSTNARGAKSGHREPLSSLFYMFPSSNTPDSKTWAPLHYAINSSFLEVWDVWIIAPFWIDCARFVA